MSAAAEYDFLILDMEHSYDPKKSSCVAGLAALPAMLKLPGVAMVLKGALDLGSARNRSTHKSGKPSR